MRGLPATPLLRALRPVLPGRWHLPAAFDPAGYLAQNPDVARGGADPALHFLRHGRAEGRLPGVLQAAAIEAAVWAGEDRRAALAALRQGQGPEALWAGLALARLAALAGDWGRAAVLLSPPEAFLDGLGLPDPLVLRAEMALRLGDRAGAARVLRLAHMRFGPLPGWHLLRAALALGLAEDGAAGWAAALDPLLAPAGLLSPVIAPGPGPAFDRLVSHPGTTPAGGAGEDAPLVSVVMPAHDAAATIDTALAGLAAQSWTRFEVLVVENGSTDDTAARVAARARRDPRFRLVAGVAGAGAYAARNLGVAQAAGGIIALHDADDWSHPDRLARQVRALLAAPAAAACLSHWVRVTPDLCPALWRPDVRPVHANLSSLMLRREVLERIGPWDRVRAGADTEFVARLRHVHGPGAVAAVLPDVPLAFGRVGPGSLTQGQTTGLTGPGAAARAAYLAAAADWHRSTALPRMPGPGAARPFPVPDALRITLREDAE